MLDTKKLIDQIKNDLKNQSSLTSTIANNVFLVCYYGNAEDTERLKEIFRKDSPYHSQRSRLSEAKKIISFGQKSKIPLGKESIPLEELASLIENNKFNGSLSIIYKNIGKIEKEYKESAEYKDKQALKELSKKQKEVVQYAIDSDHLQTVGIEKPSDLIKLLNHPMPQVSEAANEAYLLWEQDYDQNQSMVQLEQEAANAENDADTIKEWLTNCHAMNPDVFLDIASHIENLMLQPSQAEALAA